MTHSECVQSGTAWLSRRCDVVLPEFFCWNGELADVIGFKQARSASTLIECKVSRSDFFADRKKAFRIDPSKGMGDYRYYCCPKGMIRVDEVPEGWGLLYVYPSGVVRRVKESYLNSPDPTDWRTVGRFPKNKDAEFHLLFYYARRAVYAGVHHVVLAHRTGL